MEPWLLASSVCVLVFQGVLFVFCVAWRARWVAARTGEAQGNADVATRLRVIQESEAHNMSLLRTELRDMLGSSSHALEARFRSLEDRVAGRLEQLNKDVEARLDHNIQNGFVHFQKVQDSLAQAEKRLAALGTLSEAVGELKNVLNLPHLRGKIIGEGTLERLLADFLPAGFFELQYAIETKIVDAVIKFPHLGLVLPIDSKFALEQVAGLYEAMNEEGLKAARKTLSEVVRANARDIKLKYIKPELGTTDYALMYLPSETLYFEVIRDTGLWATLLEMRVFVVSPNTLATTIHTLSQSLRYYEMAQGVRQTLRQIQLAQKHMEHFRKQFQDVGDKLLRAQEAYATAGRHFDHYKVALDRLPLPSDGELELAGMKTSGVSA